MYIYIYIYIYIYKHILSVFTTNKTFQMAIDHQLQFYFEVKYPLSDIIPSHSQCMFSATTATCILTIGCHLSSTTPIN